LHVCFPYIKLFLAGFKEALAPFGVYEDKRSTKILIIIMRILLPYSPEITKGYIPWAKQISEFTPIASRSKTIISQERQHVWILPKSPRLVAAVGIFDLNSILLPTIFLVPEKYFCRNPALF
jgi:hypothetical protein